MFTLGKKLRERERNLASMCWWRYKVVVTLCHIVSYYIKSQSSIQKTFSPSHSRLFLTHTSNAEFPDKKRASEREKRVWGRQGRWFLYFSLWCGETTEFSSLSFVEAARLVWDSQLRRSVYYPGRERKNVPLKVYIERASRVSAREFLQKFLHSLMFIQLLTYTQAASGEEFHWEIFLQRRKFARKSKILKLVTYSILTHNLWRKNLF